MNIRYINSIAVAIALIALCLPAPTAVAETEFSLAIIPDTQQEVLNSSDTRFNNRMLWLATNKNSLNLKMVMHVGDVVNWGVADTTQFDIADNAFDILDTASIPYAIAIGNHDTAAVTVGGGAAPGNTNTNLRITDTYNNYFPTSRFADLAGVQQSGKMDNAYHTFNAAGLDFLVLNLELWPRTQMIDWAKSVVASHPLHNVIVVTHSFLNSTGGIEQTNGGYGDNSPQYLYDNLIKQYANIKMVFSGHAGTSAYRTDTGVNGNTIYSFLQCFHDNDTNPLRLLDIDVAEGTIDSQIYCPYTDEYKSGGTFTINNVDWVAPVPEPSSLLLLAVGGSLLLAIGLYSFARSHFGQNRA
ncbi:MAG: metallophosphoesterase [Thermoguttaceae bacterium]